MSKKDKNATDRNPESLREERKDRLAFQKGHNGRTRASRQASLKKKLTIAVAAIAALAIILYVLVSSGVPHRTFTLMQVGDSKISAATFNYWYGNILSQYNLNPNSEELTQTVGTDESGAEISMRSFLIATAAGQLQKIYTEATLAREADLELGDYQQLVDQQIENLVDQAGGAGLADMTLKQMYGSGCTLKVVRSLFENIYLASRFSTEKLDEADVSEPALEAYYQEHADSIDVVDYRGFTFDFSVSATATEAEQEAAKLEAENKAKVFLSAVESEQDFIDQALEATDEADREEYEAADGSKVTGSASADLFTAVSDWLFDAARAEGDVDIVENSSDFTVLYFLDRYRPEDPLASVRHILVAVDSEATEEEKAAAKDKADQIAAQVDSEETFIELVRTETDDKASVTEGGLYTGIDDESGLVDSFLEWSTDETRAPGDVGVVETEYGYHVMYFVENVPSWEDTVKGILQDEAYDEFINAKLEEDAFNYEMSTFAMRFVN